VPFEHRQAVAKDDSADHPSQANEVKGEREARKIVVLKGAKALKQAKAPKQAKVQRKQRARVERKARPGKGPNVNVNEGACLNFCRGNLYDNECVKLARELH